MFSTSLTQLNKVESLLQKDYEFCYVETNSIDDIKEIRQLYEKYNYIFTSTMGIKVLLLIKRKREGLECFQ